MLLIDSDIIIDGARGDAQAKEFLVSHGIAMADGFIAATALSQNIPLVSKNQRHFRYIENLNLLPYPA